ncbi:MAG: sensor histidine kinase, partial [Bacteroidota bacterium]|nr:sensor histidine kinase [Bacteroidota bacterium]
MSLNYLFSELYSVFEIIAKKKNIDFKVLKELSDEDAMIVTDETKIRKILGNLLENAFKYTEK